MTGMEVDKSVRQELNSLPKTLADDVARNLVMVARLLDEDPETAYGHAKVALRLASRVGAVREAAGFAAYSTGRYQEALAEFRAARRMTGSQHLWPIMADCERGMGRPERALDMAGADEVQKLDKAGQVEMRIVAAGARRDLGQPDAAVVTLQSSELASNSVQPWTARLRYAYADALLEVGREADAREWFAKALEADHDGATDASDRLAELDGVEFTDALDEDAVDEDGFEGAAAADEDELDEERAGGADTDTDTDFDTDSAPAAGEDGAERPRSEPVSPDALMDAADEDFPVIEEGLSDPNEERPVAEDEELVVADDESVTDEEPVADDDRPVVVDDDDRADVEADDERPADEPRDD